MFFGKKILGDSPTRQTLTRDKRQVRLLQQKRGNSPKNGRCYQHVDVDIKTIDNKLAKRRWLALSCLGGYHIGLARQECKTKGVNDRTPKKIGNRLNRSSQTIQQQNRKTKRLAIDLKYGG
jgi:hypothetical protein